MKVPHVEVLARHSGPESCGGYGNIAASGLFKKKGDSQKKLKIRIAANF